MLAILSLLSLRLLVLAAVVAALAAAALIWLLLQDPVGLGLAVGRAWHIRIGISVWF
jgi:hypothetical protein